MSSKSRSYRIRHGKRLKLVRGAFGKIVKERKYFYESKTGEFSKLKF